MTINKKRVILVVHVSVGVEKKVENHKGFEIKRDEEILFYDAENLCCASRYMNSDTSMCC